MAAQTYSFFTEGLDKLTGAIGQRNYFDVLENCQLSGSKKIERIKKYVLTNNKLANTFGLVAVNNQLHVFGTAPSPAGLPAYVVYNGLPKPPSGANMTRLIQAERVDGLFYVIAEFDDGSIHHYYGGSRVSAWDIIAQTSASLNTVAQLLADRINTGTTRLSAVAAGTTVVVSGASGVAFTTAASAVNGGVVNDQAVNIVPVQTQTAATAETRASGSITLTAMLPGEQVTSVSVDGVNVIGSATLYQGGLEATAVVLANKITAAVSVPDYDAYAVGATVYLQAKPGTGTAPNGFVVSAVVTGTATYATANFAGGVAAIAGLPQVTNFVLSGTYESQDIFTITLNGVAHKVSNFYSGIGRWVKYSKNRLYALVGNLVYASELNQFTVWPNNLFSLENYDNTPNAGYGLARFQTKLAVFCDSSIQLWNTDTDFNNTEYYDSVEPFGTVFPSTITPYGGQDVMFLNYNGYRSLQSLALRVSPAINDIGRLIDKEVQFTVANALPSDLQHSFALIEPEEERFLGFIGNRIFILTAIPSLGVKGWSTATLPFSPTAGAVGLSPDGKRRALYLRDTGNLYIYGGEDGVTYPSANEYVVRVRPKFYGGNDRSINAIIDHVDISGENVWASYVLYNPKKPDQRVNAGNLVPDTYLGHPVFTPSLDVSTFTPELVCSTGGYAELDAFTVYFKAGKER